MRPGPEAIDVTVASALAWSVAESEEAKMHNRRRVGKESNQKYGDFVDDILASAKALQAVKVGRHALDWGDLLSSSVGPAGDTIPANIQDSFVPAPRGQQRGERVYYRHPSLGAIVGSAPQGV